MSRLWQIAVVYLAKIKSRHIFKLVTQLYLVLNNHTFGKDDQKLSVLRALFRPLSCSWPPQSAEFVGCMVSLCLFNEPGCE